MDAFYPDGAESLQLSRSLRSWSCFDPFEGRLRSERWRRGKTRDGVHDWVLCDFSNLRLVGGPMLAQMADRRWHICLEPRDSNDGFCRNVRKHVAVPGDGWSGGSKLCDD